MYLLTLDLQSYKPERSRAQRKLKKEPAMKKRVVPFAVTGGSRFSLDW